MTDNAKQKRPLLMPPVVLLASALWCFALARWLPIAKFSSLAGRIIGMATIVAGVAMVLYCALEFRRRQTTIIPFQESTSLLTSGLYRFSRNPIYLGMVVLLIGIATALGSVSPWIMPPIFMAIISKRFIQKEETSLTETFGDEYLEYSRRVRRWL